MSPSHSVALSHCKLVLSSVLSQPFLTEEKKAVTEEKNGCYMTKQACALSPFSLSNTCAYQWICIVLCIDSNYLYRPTYTIRKWYTAGNKRFILLVQPEFHIFTLYHHKCFTLAKFACFPGSTPPDHLKIKIEVTLLHFDKNYLAVPNLKINSHRYSYLSCLVRASLMPPQNSLDTQDTPYIYSYHH